jgi:hypothetical protein
MFTARLTASATSAPPMNKKWNLCRLKYEGGMRFFTRAPSGTVFFQLEKI